MASSKVIVKMEVVVAHADGLAHKHLHNLVKAGVEDTLKSSGYLRNIAEITGCKVHSVADVGPIKETRWR